MGTALDASPYHALYTLSPPVPSSWLALQSLGLFLPLHGEGRHKEPQPGPRATFTLAPVNGSLTVWASKGHQDHLV